MGILNGKQVRNQASKVVIHGPKLKRFFDDCLGAALLANGGGAILSSLIGRALLGDER